MAQAKRLEEAPKASPSAFAISRSGLAMDNLPNKIALSSYSRER